MSSFSIMIDQWLNRIDKTTAEVVARFGKLTPTQLNLKPTPHTWSIAQNLDHLIVINSSYVPAIEAIRRGDYPLPFVAKFGFWATFCGKMILRSVNPDRRKEMDTFPIWEPSATSLPDTILQLFQGHQEALKALITSSADLISAEQLITSPANKNIVYTLGNAFEIIVTHEERHLAQATEVLELMD